MSSLRELLVIDRLEIGPVRVEPRRLVMPYRLRRGRSVEETELIYRFEEPVFEGDLAPHLNLAGLMGAQVALNYGLFCREMVFRGSFELADQAFLRRVLRMTAQEIYAIKFLMPNPLLRAGLAPLEPEIRKSYLQAQVHFPDPVAGESAPWSTESGRAVVLSSGGKDSLLSHGLLSELGVENHPVFVNESGRHWLTAINAHRALRAKEPFTSRVWTNSDRVFAWMLRRLPFVRQDFARLRSDDYPVRLWTVAVFLFGVLPLARKRRLGWIVVGDEFDTTVRGRIHGIGHFAGLYDQSRYFDSLMTDFFQRKGLGLKCFSILRPMSELLIQKVLLERYPHLAQQQVSCHAAHSEQGRVKPCGRCEKCRRIVGMLVGLGEDPALLGYNPDQVRRCLLDLASQGVHQERIGAEHLAWMLESAGHLPEARLGQAKARSRPEVQKLRFDAEHAPLQAIPAELRRPLFQALSRHSDGILVKRGKAFAPSSLEELLSGSPVQGSPATGSNTGREYRVPVIESRLRDDLWGLLTWPQASRRLREVDVALLPVGALEQHGPHLPLDTDAFDAQTLAGQVAIGCKAPRPLVLPLIPYGVSYHHDDFAGTISVTPETLARMVIEVGLEAARNGIRKLVIINGHGGNAPALQFAAQRINQQARIFTCVDTGESSDADVANLVETAGDVHAGEVETSTALAMRPELVDLDKATVMVPRFSSRYMDFASKRSVEWYARTARISSSGVMGDPLRASAAKGERIWQVMIRNLVEFVEQLKVLSLDEIHPRRY